MKLSKLYSNKPFKNISFNSKGLNVVIGKIDNRFDGDKHAHNLGKSLLGKVIDFMFLKEVQDKEKHFLTKNDIFNEYVFFLEIELNDGKYLLIKRGVQNNTKISFKLLENKLEGFITNIDDWTHTELPIGKAKAELNKYASFNVFEDITYRKPINYFLRSQDDFSDVFKLNKFRGKDRDWKPMVFELLNFNSDLLKKKAILDDKISETETKINNLKGEYKADEKIADKLRGAIEIERTEKESIESDIDKFNFYDADNRNKTLLVDDIDNRIRNLNSYHYQLKSESSKIESSLQEGFDHIDVSELKGLYEEISVYFPKEIIKDYESLVDFNRDISTERIQILKENLLKIQSDINNVGKELLELEKEKSNIILCLTDQDTFSKFKFYQKELSQKEANIIRLEEKLKSIDTINLLLKEVRDSKVELGKIIEDIQDLIGGQNHSEIRKIFAKIIKEVLNTQAVLSISQNKEGNVEFTADYTDIDNIKSTQEGDGNTFKKLLCATFDLSILIFYSDQSFYRFVYHDGIFDDFDIRKVKKYLNVVREITDKYNLQYILTAIESQLSDEFETIKLEDSEICLNISDSSPEDKLFMQNF